LGHVAVQIAKALGAEVIATTSPEKRDFVRALGPDQVIDYRESDFTKVTRDIDVVLELMGKDYGDRSLEILRPGGLLVTAVQRRERELAARVEAAGRRFAGISVEPDHVGLEALASLADQGRLKVHVTHTFALERVAEAHGLLETGRP
jgi:NADPH:quinone reductase-like Zn-dependent oxidoreductase